MDVTAISTFVTSLGFPIACCIALFWYLMKESENHRAEMNTMREAVENNTLVLQKLLDKLNAEGDIVVKRD